MELLAAIYLILALSLSGSHAYTYVKQPDYQQVKEAKEAAAAAGGKEALGPCGGTCGCMMGPQGTPGIPGVPGMHGNRGQDGMKGQKGEAGIKGEQGLTGFQGAQGPIGPMGHRGKKGPDGPIGKPGDLGEKGQKGERGYSGLPGQKGSPGDAAAATKKVAFSVGRSQKLGPVLQDTAVTFDTVYSNVGAAFDEYSSHFVCRVNGTYLFLTHILAQNEHNAYAWIMQNSKHKVPLHADERAGYGTGSQSVILSLQADDHVWIQLSKDSALLNDYSTFSGFLLFEDDPDDSEGGEAGNYIPAAAETTNSRYWFKK